MATTQTIKGLTMEVEITLGRVLVFVPVYDCENKKRFISFERSGKVLMGGCWMHWTAKPFAAAARIAARKAIATL